MEFAAFEVDNETNVKPGDFEVVDHLAKLVVGDEELLIRSGEWSEWVPIEFEMMPTQGLPAIARFYLRSVAPHFELYVSPLNIDPSQPIMPVSTPDYSGCLETGFVLLDITVRQVQCTPINAFDWPSSSAG